MQTLLVACALFTDHSLISKQVIQDARSAGLSPQDTVIAACGTGNIENSVINWAEAQLIISQAIKRQLSLSSLNRGVTLTDLITPSLVTMTLPTPPPPRKKR